MSGTIHPTTPWARTYLAAVPAEERAAVEAAIPSGCFISFGARRKPGDWSMYLLRRLPVSDDADLDHTPRPVKLAEVFGQRTIVGGCYAVLHLAREATNA